MILMTLRSILDEQHINQSDLQKRTGIRPGTISDIFNNRSKMIPVDVLEVLCEALDVQPNKLLVFIPKDEELKYWQRYVAEGIEDRNERTFGDISSYINRTGYYYEFAKNLDLLLNPSDYHANRRKKVLLSELLEARGLRLYKGTVLTACDYYIKAREDLSRKIEQLDYEYQAFYNLLVENLIVPCTPDFFDDAYTSAKKQARIKRFFADNKDIDFEKKDKLALIPASLLDALRKMQKKEKDTAKANKANPQS